MPRKNLTPKNPNLVRVSELGEFIHFESCERRFRLAFNAQSAARTLPFFNRFFSPLDIVLHQAGKDAENEWRKQLLDRGYKELTHPSEDVAVEQDEEGGGFDFGKIERTPWGDFSNRLKSLKKNDNAFGREIVIRGRIGDFDVEGAIDFILLHWDGGSPRMKLIEGKRSRKDKTYHRIQAVTYYMLLKQALENAPLTVAGYTLSPQDIKIAIARVQEDTGNLDDLVCVEPIHDIDREKFDVERLLSPNGRLRRIVESRLDDLEFHLCKNCDACTYNLHCLTESARARRLELLSIDPTACRSLRNAGVGTIDDLAKLDTNGEIAKALRHNPGFSESLLRLVARAKARKSTLLNEPNDPDHYQVVGLPGAGQSQLPLHIIENDPIIRIYLAVDYDYTENRVGAISAHLTKSSRQLHFKWIEAEDGERAPDPNLYERDRIEEVGSDGKRKVRFGNESAYEKSQNSHVVCILNSPWTGVYIMDTGAERSLIQDFFVRLVEAIEDISNDDEFCRLHFYIWNRNEMSRLIEACARADSRLLGHLRELLGAREGLEQLIFSCVGEEVDRRYGLGWTGRGLVVAASLGWFGQRYHWTRNFGKETVQLDDVFTQDLFDFKTTLGIDSSGNWVKDIDAADRKHRFEIRSRNFDSLPAPYWRAVWGTLPLLGEKVNHNIKAAVERYQKANRRLLRAYLEARVHALRWIEEKCSWKNEEIFKPKLRVADLPQFDLGVSDIGRASIDVLRLDGHVAANRWISARLICVRERVANGLTLPIKNFTLIDQRTLSCEINTESYDVDMELAQALWDVGSFVRLTIHDGNPDTSQSIRTFAKKGMTGEIVSVNWDRKHFSIALRGSARANQDPYVFQSTAPKYIVGEWKYGTLDDSPSDFVSGRVEERIRLGRRTPAIRWFDPTSPAISELAQLDADVIETTREILSSVKDEAGHCPDSTQVNAILEGLNATVQLLQGPPGTGKTGTTALSIYSRILVRRHLGDIILVGSNTHTAVNEIVGRLIGYREEFAKQSVAHGKSINKVIVARIDPKEHGNGGADIDIDSASCVRAIHKLQQDAVVVLAGVTGGILKAALELEGSKLYNFVFSELIIDEASMVVFPHFLSLAMLMPDHGLIMLAGDNRQLAPILAHAWDQEDRPPVETYQPHISAYDAVANLCSNGSLSKSAVTKSSLSITFRLPPRVVNLIARVYEQDKIRLEGRPRGAEVPAIFGENPWEGLWTGNAGLFLVVHDERQSRKVNHVEIEILHSILNSAPKSSQQTTAVVTPHRAQKHTLQRKLRGMVGLVDTVERLQGGQRKTIIVSGCVSDPSAINSMAEFILDLKRSNVAFSRVQDRLIVVCSQSLLDAIPADVENYDSAMLWKALRTSCSHLHKTINVKGYEVRIFGPSFENIGTGFRDNA